MPWIGKIIGGLLGLILFPRFGLFIGVFLGHLIDLEILRNRGGSRLGGAGPGQGALPIQESFFRATFQVMGHVAKADGRVSAEEIQAARAAMQDFRLSEPDIRRAIALFTEGKSPGFPLDTALSDLRRRLGSRPDLCRMFVQVQLQAAIAGDSLNPASRAVLGRVCAALDISAYELAHMESILRMRGSQRQQSYQAPAGVRLSQAYEVLGVESTASDAEVRKAYRRLMNQNHPDKLVAKGLPEAMMKVAEDKTREILTAYEAVREARGLR
jgi:DnaJ like chaperone protein